MSWYSSLFFWRRLGPRLGHLDIPGEIIIMITRHLDSVSRLSLDLTCQNFYYLAQAVELSISEKRELLLLIEEDAAHLYFCHFCVKLHRWHAAWYSDSYYRRRDFSRQAQDCCRMMQMLKTLRSFELPYPLARVVMNRHFYGVAHGVPPQTIAVNYGWRKDDTKFHKKWDARVIDDQLILSSVLTITANGDGMMLRRHVDSCRSQLCPHIDIGDNERKPRPPELVKNGCLHYFTPCHQSIKSCILCFTDCCIDITAHKNKWIITLTTYHLLGSVRSPFDCKWSSAMTRYANETGPKVVFPEEHRPGSVRHMWSKADDKVLEPEGEWLDSHPLPCRWRRIEYGF